MFAEARVSAAQSPSLLSELGAVAARVWPTSCVWPARSCPRFWASPAAASRLIGPDQPTQDCLVRQPGDLAAADTIRPPTQQIDLLWATRYRPPHQR